MGHKHKPMDKQGKRQTQKKKKEMPTELTGGAKKWTKMGGRDSDPHGRAER